MSTETIEASDALGEPIELFQFAYGTGAANTIGYTDTDFEIQHDQVVYQPLTISRGDISAGGNTLDRSTLEIDVPADSAIAQLFIGYPPSAVVGLTIYRCHWDADAGAITTPGVIWLGRTLGPADNGNGLATLACEPVTTSARRLGLRRHWQHMCPHVLYGSACGAVRTDNTRASQCVAFNARAIRVAGEFGTDYQGGVVSWQPTGAPEERRTILATAFDADSNQTLLTVAGRPAALAAGDGLAIARGCKRTLTDCRTFDNAPNFGGDPWIPLQNPHGKSTIYN